MKKARCYKNLFLVAAAWNLVAGLTCWLGGIFMPETFFGMFGMS